jgi:hypothetical protein
MLEAFYVYMGNQVASLVTRDGWKGFCFGDGLDDTRDLSWGA